MPLAQALKIGLIYTMLGIAVVLSCAGLQWLVSDPKATEAYIYLGIGLLPLAVLNQKDRLAYAYVSASLSGLFGLIHMIVDTVRCRMENCAATIGPNGLLAALFLYVSCVIVGYVIYRRLVVLKHET